MVLSRLTKITGPGIRTDTNWVGNNANYTGILTAASLGGIGNLTATGIITASSFSGNVTAVDGTFSGNVSIAGTLTYEDVTNIDSVGIITAPALDVDDFLDVGSNIKLGNAGVITATSFVGSGAALTGIDATAIKDSGGNVKIQAQASGAIHSGVSTFQDIDVDGHTNLDNVSIAGVSTFSGDVKIDAGTSTTLTVEADSAGVAMVKATGGSGAQATAAFELVQSTTSVQGGGISYNGDGSPSFVSGETADNVTFYRILNGTRSEVFSYPYNSDTVTFNSTVIAPLFQGNLSGTVNTAAQPNITSLGTLSSLTLSGTTSPVSFTHTGGNCVTFNRNSKSLTINANYAGQNGYSNITMTSGMDIRWSLGGLDRINFKSAGHIEPVTDSSINLGADARRFANVYADTLYGDGSNLTGITQTTINNNANNRIITGSGTANTLEGESTLTYNGTDTLELQPASATPAVFVGDSNRTGAGQGLVHFKGNWNGTTVARITIDTGDDTSNKDDGIIRFDTAPAGTLIERLRIDRLGKITHSASGGDNQYISKRTSATDSNGNYFFQLFANNNNDTTVGSIGIHRDTANDDARMVFHTRNTGGSNQERLRITSGGNMGLGTTPDTKLHIYEQSGSSSCYLKIENNRSRNAAVQFTTTLGSWYVGNGIGADSNTFMVYDSTPRLYINTSGKVYLPTANSTNTYLNVKNIGISRISTSERLAITDIGAVCYDYELDDIMVYRSAGYWSGIDNPNRRGRIRTRNLRAAINFDIGWNYNTPYMSTITPLHSLTEGSNLAYSGNPFSDMPNTGGLDNGPYWNRSPDEANDYIVADMGTTAPTAKVSLLCWYKSDSNNSQGTSNGGSWGPSVWLFGDTRNSVSGGFGINSSKPSFHYGSNSRATASSSPSVTDGSWHHIAFVWDGPNNDLKMYTDGTLYYTNTNLTNVNANIQFDRIGSGYNYSYTVAPENMANVLIYDQIITDVEVKGAYYARNFYRDTLH